MKIILSRKGFDSSNGGIPSPILSGGTLYSLPIPSDDEASYEDLRFFSDDSLLVSSFLKDVKPALSQSHCHVDPDLVQRYVHEPFGWKPAFGQRNAAQSYLQNTAAIKPGDLFLFFGNFRVISYAKGLPLRFCYSSHPSVHGKTVPTREIQFIWGYLQIGEILTDPQRIREYSWHPHANEAHLKDKTNALYIPAEHLSFDKDMPGCGVFNYSERRVLTIPGANKATWKVNPVYIPDSIIGTRKDSAKDGGIYYSGIWQELCLMETAKAETWAKQLVRGTFFTTREKMLLRNTAKSADGYCPFNGWPFPKPELFDVLTHIEDDHLDANEISFLRIGAQNIKRFANVRVYEDPTYSTELDEAEYQEINDMLDRYQKSEASSK